MTPLILLILICNVIGCRIRKNIHTLNKTELETLVRGFKWVYKEKTLERLSNKHYNLQKVIHGCAQFLPFHNTFIYDLETELIKYDSKITLPYWNWTEYSNRPLSDPVLRYFGDIYTKRTNHCVNSGNFANWTFNGNCFKREYNDISGNHIGWSTINNLVYSTDSFSTMTQNLEQLHSFFHVWVSGDMKTHHSPNDPLFYLHHAFVDKVWYDWKTRYTNHRYGWRNNDNTTISFKNTINGYNLTVLDVLTNKNCVRYLDMDINIKINDNVKNNFNVNTNVDIKSFLQMSNYDNDSITNFLSDLNSDRNNRLDLLLRGLLLWIFI